MRKVATVADHDFDLLVLGGGSGGVRAARMAAQRGARVGLIEAGPLGGTCVNVGCIPKKLYSFAAHYAEAFHEAPGFGWVLPEAPRFDWTVLKTNRKAEITRLNGIYLQLLQGAGVTVLRGWGRLAGMQGGAQTVSLQQDDGTQRSFSARHILLATGGRAVLPPIPGHELAVTSDHMFDLPEFPKRLLVVGGGYIACEFASIFNGLGAQVTQLYRGEQILRGFDHDIRHFLAAEMGKAGVNLRLHSDVRSLQKTPSGILVTLHDGSTLEADTVLYATGRAPNVADLGLDAAGVRVSDTSAIAVDEYYETSVKGIHALGDVTARVQLTPVALGEGMALVDRLFGPAAGKRAREMSYTYIPTAVFTHPNVGTVGLTEHDARKALGDGGVRIYRSEFKALKHTLSGSTERTLMKLVVDDASDRVVGLHMVGADAGEIVQGFAVAMKAGATKAVFDSTIGIHPTAAEEFVTMRDPVTVAPAQV